MPVTIKTGVMKYKDPTTGNYVDVDAVGNILSDTIAPDYSDLTYPVAAGKLCYHESKLYSAKQAISTVEVWTASHWDEVTVEEELNRKYTKPSGGIPASDIANGVIPDVSGFYTKPAGGIPSSDLANGVIPDVSGFYTKPSGGIPASDIAAGVIPDPENLIDDEAGEGDTDKVWSADKISDETSRLSGAINANRAMIADAETSTTAAHAHAVKTVFILNNKLLMALSAIAVGDTITTTGATPNAADVTIADAFPHDVQVNGSSVVTDGVANVPIADATNAGAVIIGAGLTKNASGKLVIDSAGAGTIKTGTNVNQPIVPGQQHTAAFYGLAKASGDSTQSSSSNAVGVYTESAKSSISQMLDAPETVSGTTPSITAKAGVRYICGEVATLTIVVPASGIIDVTFDSGSTPTVLTVTPPTGMTMKWTGGFDPTSLEANKTYELNIMDGCLGVGASWT